MTTLAPNDVKSVLADPKVGVNLLGPVPTVVAPKPVRCHIGVHECGGLPPAWNVHLAGLSFPVKTSTFDEMGNEFLKAGTIEELTVDQIQRVRKALEKRVVKWRAHPKTGKRIAAEIWLTDRIDYKPDPTDEPLAKYLYVKLAPPEFQQPTLAAEMIADLDRALAAATVSEDKALGDPKDARHRERAAAAKASAGRLEPDDEV